MQTESEQLFEESKKYIPGGVNSPVRAFGSVGRSPIFIKKAKGSRIFDEDGREYIDYVCSWGPNRGVVAIISFPKAAGRREKA